MAKGNKVVLSSSRGLAEKKRWRTSWWFSCAGFVDGHQVPLSEQRMAARHLVMMIADRRQETL